MRKRVSQSHLTLFLIGVALSIAQFIMIRDFVAILYGEEVVILLVSASFFLGLSVGYLLASRLSLGLFRALFVAAVFAHLSFPVSYRYLAGWFSEARLEGYWFIVLLFTYAVMFNTLFATILPRLVGTVEGSSGSAVHRMKTLFGLALVSLGLAGLMGLVFRRRRLSQSAEVHADWSTGGPANGFSLVRAGRPRSPVT